MTIDEYQCRECGARYSCEETAGNFGKCPKCRGQIVWRPADLDGTDDRAADRAGAEDLHHAH